MRPHKHAELIKAWADGKKIQYRDDLGHWEDLDGHFFWCDDSEYRIKPEPKPDLVKLFQANFQCAFEVKPFDANLKLTFDGETGELKSAEVLR